LRVRRFDRGKERVEAQRRRHRGNGRALQEMSSGDRQMQNSCWLEESLCLSMIFSENRFTLFRIMLY